MVMVETRYQAGTPWTTSQKNIILEEYQKNPKQYLKNSMKRMGRSYNSVKDFVKRNGGIKRLFRGDLPE